MASFAFEERARQARNDDDASAADTSVEDGTGAKEPGERLRQGQDDATRSGPVHCAAQSLAGIGSDTSS